MQLRAFDAKNNLVEWSLSPFTLQVSEGTILYDGVSSSSHTLQRFRQQAFYYQASGTGTASSAKISILAAHPSQQPKNADYYQNIVSATPNVLVGGKSLALSASGSEEVVFSLRNEPEAIFQKDLQLRLQDAQGKVLSVASQVRIRSLGGLVQVGTMKRGKFAQTSTFALSGGQLSFSLLSKKVAGNDLVMIEIPDLDPVYLTVNVQAASAFRVDMPFSLQTMQVGQALSGNLRITDLRGNLVTIPTAIQLTTTSNLRSTLSDQLVSTRVITGSEQLLIKGIKPGV